MLSAALCGVTEVLGGVTDDTHCAVVLLRLVLNVCLSQYECR